MRTLLVLLVLLAAGCTSPSEGGNGPTPETKPAAVQAPWWNLGESWTIAFEGAGIPGRTTTLVNFANDTFGDPPHFWLGTTSRQEALDHVFFDTNPFLGRIHWILLAPHEKGMHSTMYEFPLRDGAAWTTPILFGKEDLSVEAKRQADGTFAITGEARADGSTFAYDYDPATRWFRDLEITEADGATALRATVTDHEDSGARGTYYFLRGRDYLDADGGTTGEEETFEVKEEGATSIAFLLDVRTTGPSALEFVDPAGTVWHRETLALGGTADKVVEVSKHPPAGTWRLRYVGNVQGDVLVRGIIEYKATL